MGLTPFASQVQSCLGFTKFTRSDALDIIAIVRTESSLNPDLPIANAPTTNVTALVLVACAQHTMEAPPWASGLHRSRLYYEGVVDYLEKTLELHRKATVTTFGTRTSSSLSSTNECNKENRSDVRHRWAEN